MAQNTDDVGGTFDLFIDPLHRCQCSTGKVGNPSRCARASGSIAAALRRNLPSVRVTLPTI